MGRSRIEDEDKKKVDLKLSIRKDVADKAKEAYPKQLSELFENYLKKLLNIS